MRALICSLIVATTFSAALDAEQTAAPPFRLNIVTTTYFANGEVRKQTAGDLAVAFGGNTTIYAHSGPTVCGQATAVDPATAAQLADKLTEARSNLGTLQSRYTQDHPELVKARKLYEVLMTRRAQLEPAKAAYGWRVDVRPIEERDGALIIETTWTRLWDAGTRLSSGLSATYTLSLKGNGQLQLDRLPVSPGSNSCGAIGIGLDITLRSTRATVVETEVWLVHRHPNGSETSEKQVLRSATGTPSSFIFPKGVSGVDLSGQISPVDPDGTLELAMTFVGPWGTDKFQVSATQVELNAHQPPGGETRISGSIVTEKSGTRATLKFRPTNPAEVIALPLTASDDHVFSLRIRSKKIE